MQKMPIEQHQSEVTNYESSSRKNSEQMVEEEDDIYEDVAAINIVKKQTKRDLKNANQQNQ